MRQWCGCTGAGTFMPTVVEPQSLEGSAEQLRSALLSMLQAGAIRINAAAAFDGDPNARLRPSHHRIQRGSRGSPNGLITCRLLNKELLVFGLVVCNAAELSSAFDLTV